MPWGMPGGGQSAPGWGGMPQMQQQMMLQQMMGMMWQGGMPGGAGVTGRGRGISALA